MPRPPSSVWNHFRRSDDGNRRAVCKFCRHEMASLVARMKTHLIKRCPSCPDDIKNNMKQLQLAAAAAAAAAASVGGGGVGLLNSSGSSAANGVKIEGARTRRISGSGGGSIGGANGVNGWLSKKEYEDTIWKAVYGGALPVCVTENANFAAFLKKFFPSHDVPTSFRMSNSLLDRGYENVQQEVYKTVADAPMVCLTAESWSSSRNRSLITYMTTTPNINVYDIVNTGEHIHSTDYLLDSLQHVIEKIGVEKVAVVVTDTSSNMVSTWKLLENSYPGIVLLPSCSHGIKNLVRNVLLVDWISAQYSTCESLVQFFESHHIFRASLCRIAQVKVGFGSSFLVSPKKEDPQSMLECLFSINRSKDPIQYLLSENKSLRRQYSVIGEVCRDSFWNDLAAVCNFFSPFSDVLKIFESDRPMLSTFYHRFKNLLASVATADNIPDLDIIQQTISRHWIELEHPAMATSYLLDPRYPPVPLSADSMGRVMEYLKATTSPDSYPSLVNELTKFTGRVGLFADKGVWESAAMGNPIHWWKGFIGSTCPNLQKVAIRNLSFPASSTVSDKKMNVFDQIYQNNREHLSDEQISKLAYLYWNLNQENEVDDAMLNVTVV